MRVRLSLLVAMAIPGLAGCGGDSDTGTSPSDALPRSTVSFFVSSSKSPTGNLGGLRGADAICQNLAGTVGLGGKTWRAYLSADRDPDNGNRPVDARTRIGSGPWFNTNGLMLARDLTDLHARIGDASVFLDEHGQRIPGQWTGSPPPVEHDILTGSNADGTLAAGFTCDGWTSTAATLQSRVGHSDGLGPGQATTGTFTSWNSSHTGQCGNTVPGGGAGRIYCFAQ